MSTSLALGREEELTLIELTDKSTGCLQTSSKVMLVRQLCIFQGLSKRPLTSFKLHGNSVGIAAIQKCSSHTE